MCGRTLGFGVTLGLGFGLGVTLGLGFGFGVTLGLGGLGFGFGVTLGRCWSTGRGGRGFVWLGLWLT
jgi:hypothetical protein